MHSGREDEQTVTDTAAEEATTITTTHEGAFATQTVVIAADKRLSHPSQALMRKSSACGSCL
jgi:hypothetical protein